MKTKLALVTVGLLLAVGVYAAYVNRIDCGQPTTRTVTNPEAQPPGWPDLPYIYVETPSKDWKGQCWFTKEITMTVDGKPKKVSSVTRRQ